MDRRKSMARSRWLPMLTAAVTFSNLLTPLRTGADHLEGKQRATGAPEHVLCGIDVYKTAVTEVIKAYGEPTEKRDIPAVGLKDGVGGERNYTWVKVGLRLAVWTGYHNDHESSVYGVDVWGPAPQGELGKSGRGLALGSTLQQQKAICGDRFFVSSRDKGKVKSVLLEWRDGTQLVADYDPDGHISHMQLSADIE